MGIGQRDLSAALLVSAGFGEPDTLEMTLVACLVLMVSLILVGGEAAGAGRPEKKKHLEDWK